MALVVGQLHYVTLHPFIFMFLAMYPIIHSMSSCFWSIHLPNMVVSQGFSCQHSKPSAASFYCAWIGSMLHNLDRILSIVGSYTSDTAKVPT